MKRITSILLLITCTAILQAGSSLPDYRNPKLPVEQRTKDLLSCMTLEEKVAQMTCLIRLYDVVDSAGSIDSAFMNERLVNGIGQISDYTIRGRSAECFIAFQNHLQSYLLHRTRLGIPAIIHSEGTRSAMFNGATLFPAAIALAGTWDVELVQKINRVIAEESRARGIQQVLAPVVDVAREPRWGRIEETFGEDPYLVSQMGIHAVRGLQGEHGQIDSFHVLATLKHFAAYSQPERGLNGAANNYSERILRDVFFPPFREAIQKGGAMSVMASYNEIDGVPSTLNRRLLTDILRNEWGFDGTVVTDYGCFRGDLSDHRISDDSSEIARLACTAGVNIEYPQPYFYPKLIGLVRNGIIPESRIDEMVYPILEQKFKLGLFERPYLDPKKIISVSNKATSGELALDAARESIILLKNSGDVCPIVPSKIKTIAVIGPHADGSVWGNVAMAPKHFVTVCEGMRKKAGESVRVLSSEGCKITVVKNKALSRQDRDDALRQIDSAVAVANQADVVVLALGGNSETANFNVDSPTLDLPGYQEELADAVGKTGKPMIVLIFGGKPFAIPWVYERANSVFYCWYLGQETGTAVADALFGDYNPGGKLPITIPRSAGHLPAFYNHKPQQMGHYVLDEISPLYPFGYGLSYTSFRYCDLKLQSDTIKADESCTATINVSNIGTREGDEIVELYIRDLYSSVTRPVKELKDFKRVHLKPGETRIVEFTVTPDKLSFVDINKKTTVEPGDFIIMVGSSSEEYQTANLRVVR